MGNGNLGNRKELLREFCKKNIDILKDLCIIESNHTGKVLIEINLNQGALTDVKISPEIRA